MRTQAENPLKIRKKFSGFIKVLKEAGVTVSTAEILDMFAALEHTSFDDREIFKQTLSTTLIKDYTDLPVFEKCFHEFFEKKGGKKDLGIDRTIRNILESGAMSDAHELTEDEQDLLDQMIDQVIEQLAGDSPLEKSPRDILSIILENPELKGSSGGLGMLLFNARSREGSSHGDEGEQGEGKPLDITELLLQRIQRRITEHNIGKSINQRDQYLLTKPIYRLTPAEVKEMREVVKRLGQKLKNKISLRKKKVKHGGLDVKKTLRSNLQYGGTPFKLYHKDKRIDRPQLVVLCDISSSVNQYSRFMLLLTYTLQSLFSKVRSFAFISTMVEITPLFMEMDPERALNSIFTDENFTYGWGSNYGRCFNQFAREFSDSLSSKTTVLILGDARNNNQDPGLESFMKIGERSRNIFWLNPDKQHLWNWNDSIAGIYIPYCTEMKEVNNFLDLTEFIDKLFS